VDDAAALVEDAALLDAWREGDASAGEQLFERHFDAVARFFRNKVDEAPDDLVQRTFLGCVESRETFRGDASFRTFLFAVAHNVLRNYFRSRRSDRTVDFSVDSAFGLLPSPSAVVAQHRTQQLLLDALRRIPLEYQVALELHYWEDMTAAELAAVEGIPVGTAKTRLRRGKELLAGALAELAPAAAIDLSGLGELRRIVGR
jgi:RNA polymerase sigma-70 factor (ECF subfamily)